jgi:hypothetical protein
VKTEQSFVQSMTILVKVYMPALNALTANPEANLKRVRISFTSNVQHTTNLFSVRCASQLIHISSTTPCPWSTYITTTMKYAHTHVYIF